MMNKIKEVAQRINQSSLSPLIALVFIILTGCANQYSANNEAEIKGLNEEDGFPIHGEFCGRNIPTISPSLSKEHAITFLKSIKSFDSIDEECKAHDICYTKEGINNINCDEILLKSLNKLQRNFKGSSAKEAMCFQLINSFQIAFLLKNKNIWNTLHSDHPPTEMLEEAFLSSVTNIYEIFGLAVAILYSYPLIAGLSFHPSDITQPRYNEVCVAP